MRFNRLENLIGKTNSHDLQDKTIAVFGLGGVGSFAAEALVRSGIGHIKVIDYDVVDITNMNRQLIALTSTVGRLKTEVFKERALDINPNMDIDTYHLKVNFDNINEILLGRIDFVLDCIDDVEGKLALVEYCQKNDIRLLMSLGFANKFHPEMIRISSLNQTMVCPLAKSMRRKVKERGLDLQVTCVYSQEKPSEVIDKSVLGSTAFVPSSAGLMMSSYVINQLLEDKFMKKMILAGGCFWGVQAYFDRVKGVTFTETGYIDGMSEKPTYQDVLNGSGHTEAIYLEYDEDKISLKKILDHYFNIIDPTLINRQGNDIGINYRTGIYCFNKEEMDAVLRYINEISHQYTKPIVTDVKMANDFYRAEDYHQKYLDKVPGGYCHINLNSVNNIKDE